MITVTEVEQIMKNKNIAFIPPDEYIKKWADENYGMAYTIALTIVYQFISFVQEWNSKDLSIPDTNECVDKPIDKVFSKCCNGEVEVGGDEGTYYYICDVCHKPCDVVKADKACVHGDFTAKLDSDGDVYYECGRCGAACYEMGM